MLCEQLLPGVTVVSSTTIFSLLLLIALMHFPVAGGAALRGVDTVMIDRRDAIRWGALNGFCNFYACRKSDKYS